METSSYWLLGELVAHKFSVSKLDLFVPMRNTSLKLIATTQIARKESI